MDNFIRSYTLKAGVSGKTGFEISELHISFNVEKSTAETPNSAKIQIWNLSEQNLRILDTKDCLVELKAGYGDNLSLLTVGNVVSVVTVMDNADRMTEVEIVDGLVAIRDTVISVSMNGKVDCKKLYEDIAKKMGLTIMLAKDLKFKSFSNGFSFVGKAKNALKKVADYSQQSWTIHNGVLHITNKGRGISSRGYVLSSDTGLISFPKRLGIEKDGKSYTGWEVRYFLNGAIGINDTVKVESKTVSGFFLVQSIVMDGDNMDGEWICTAQLLEIKTDPKLDKALKVATSGSKPSDSEIKKGDKVKVAKTFREGNKTKANQYSGETFVCWYDVYDVIQVKGDRVVIGIGSAITAAVRKSDLVKA